MQLSYLAEDGGAVIDMVQNGTMRTEILAARIISNHLDLLGKNQMKQLARACSCKLEEVASGSSADPGAESQTGKRIWG